MALGVVLGIASGVASIAGGIGKANAQKKAYKKQKKHAEKVADMQNEYNEKKFKADKENFLKMREYNFETALTKWRYNQDIQDYREDATNRAYEKDQQNLKNTLAMNNIAAQQAYISEQRVMREIEAQQTFAREEQYIENLRSQGRARLGQAGRSTDRAVQMTAAEHGRNLAILDASFTSSVAQHNMNMFDIALNKFGADLNARANAMLRPEKLPGIPQPTKPPEPVWVEPMKILPNYVQKPDTTGTILGGISSGLGAFAGAANAAAAASNPGATPVPGGGDGYSAGDAAIFGRSAADSEIIANGGFVETVIGG